MLRFEAARDGYNRTLKHAWKVWRNGDIKANGPIGEVFRDVGGEYLFMKCNPLKAAELREIADFIDKQRQAQHPNER